MQLSISQAWSVFEKAYNKGLKKSEYREPTLEDALNLVAKIPSIVLSFTGTFIEMVKYLNLTLTSI